MGRAENGALFVVAPFSARPSPGPILRSARTGKGTLATQAIRALDYYSGGLRFKCCSLSPDGFRFSGPRFNSSTL